MDISWILSVSGFLWVAAITPGPNNILLTSSAANFGWRQTWLILLGIMFGMQVLLILSALSIGGLLTLFPSLYFILKLTGSVYLLWLAWKIATAPSECLETQRNVAPVSFIQASLLQCLNPKAWLMILGAISSFSVSEMYVNSIIAISLILAIINGVAGIIWGLFGIAIGYLLNSRKVRLIFNISLGLLTAFSVTFIWL